MEQTGRIKKTGKKHAAGSADSRELVLEALLAIGKEQEYSHVVLRRLLQKYNYLTGQEKAFIKRLFEGTLERRIELDYCIDAVSSLPVRKMKPPVRELLRLSAYQLLYMDSVPDWAVCDEAVRLARKRSLGSLTGFVNGVLRALIRRKGRIPYPDAQTQRTAALSVRYSMPKWLIEKWEKEQGREMTERILAGLLRERPVILRIREGAAYGEDGPTSSEVLAELKERGILVRQNAYLPYAYELKRTEDLTETAAWREGACTVQDVSSMLAVEAAGIRPGDYVIDVCAAPGGKMLFAAQKAGPGGRVLARDVSETKMTLMSENKERMKAKNLTLQLWDACVLDEKQAGRADVALADVPCSGLGVIGRKKDIKYRLNPENLEELVSLQRRILTAVQNYVKPGGVLLYSTCTINRQENEEMAEWFSENFPFHAESLLPYFPERLRRGPGSETLERGYFQFLPGIHDTDGFFIARFKRD